MDNNSFFRFITRLNSVLFLILLLISTGFAIYGTLESQKWNQKNSVKVTDTKSGTTTDETLKLGDITKVCGKDIQYVELKSGSKGSGFSSGDYDYNRKIRNVVFFVGTNMDTHWLFETNNYLIGKVSQLKKTADDCKDRETVAIYYEINKEDTNKDGKLDENDSVAVAITTPDGLNYKEIESGLTSVLDHSVDAEAAILTLLAEYKSTIYMKKFSTKTGEKISEKELTKIAKN